jgi:hypothetical protein
MLVLAVPALAAPAVTHADTSPTPPRVRPPVLSFVRLKTVGVTQFSAVVNVTVTSAGVQVVLTPTATGPGGVVIPGGPMTATTDGDVALTLPGLQPHTRYSWTVVATRAERTRTLRGSFVTPSLLTMPRPAISSGEVEYGNWVTVTGTIPGAAGLAVELQKQLFPYSGPFAAESGAAGATDAQGNYTFKVQALASAKYGVAAIAYKAPNLANTVQLRVTAAIVAHATRGHHGRFVVSGRYRPDVPSRATLYRVGHGRAGVAVVPMSAGANSRTFRFPARRLKPGRYEIRLVTSRDTGIENTESASFTIPRR